MVSSNIRHFRKFDSLEAAQQYGIEVDFIAATDDAKVPAGRSGNPKSIFRGDPIDSSAESIGDYHRIIKAEQPRNSENAYEVAYATATPRGAKRADVLLATRKAEAYLDEKLQELGGKNTTGIPR